MNILHPPPIVLSQIFFHKSKEQVIIFSCTAGNVSKCLILTDFFFIFWDILEIFWNELLYLRGWRKYDSNLRVATVV